MAERVRAFRGAITVDEDTREQVIERTARLVQTMMERNGIAVDDLVSMVFTATGDIRSEFPAAAARSIGISHVPLLCARELDIDGGIPRCIRVLMHAYSERSLTEVRHVYLEQARQLRTDLPE